MKKLIEIAVVVLVILGGAVASQCVAETIPDDLTDLSVEVWSSANDGPMNKKSKVVEFDDRVMLYAVVSDGERRYSDNPRAVEKGVTLPLSQLGVEPEYRWYKVETERSMYCTKGGFKQFLSDSSLPKKMAWYFFDKMKLDRPEYTSTRFAKGVSRVAPEQGSEKSNSIEWDGREVGTMRFSVEVRVGGRRISSYGEEHLESGDFSRMKKVHRISVKADTGNPVLDMGFAHGNLPYFYGSDSPRWEWYGADCGKFVSSVYARVVDRNFGYLGTAKLIQKRARSIVNGVDDDGVYTYNGKKIEFGRDVRVGDIIVINPRPHHTGLIGQDVNRNGFLDRDDPVLHTGRRAPEYQPMGKTSLGTPSDRLKILKVQH